MLLQHGIHVVQIHSSACCHHTMTLEKVVPRQGSCVMSCPVSLWPDQRDYVPVGQGFCRQGSISATSRSPGLTDSSLQIGSAPRGWVVRDHVAIVSPTARKFVNSLYQDTALLSVTFQSSGDASKLQETSQPSKYSNKEVVESTFTIVEGPVAGRQLETTRFGCLQQNMHIFDCESVPLILFRVA